METIPAGYIMAVDGRFKHKVKSRKNLFVFIAALVMFGFFLFALTWVTTRNGIKAEEKASTGTNGGAVHERTRAEAPQAKFLSIFVTTSAGGLASYMVGGDTDEFMAFADALVSAQPVEGISDETFADILVLSFGNNDTLEIPYSRTRNLFIIDETLYQPSANLGPMIAAVEQRFSN